MEISLNNTSSAFGLVEKISVCVFAYNKEKYISKCIESILMQKTSYKFKIIIGEDYSTDSTKEICKRYEHNYPDKIHVLDRGRNLGQVKNYYDTLCNAKGDFIALMDADDYWIDPLKLQKQTKFLNDNPEYYICFHNAFVYEEKQYSNLHLFNRALENPSMNDVISNWLMATSTIVFRNKIDFSLRWLYDLSNPDLMIQLLAADMGKIKYFNEIMGVYLLNDSGLTFNKEFNLLLNAERQKVLFEKFNDYTEKKYFQTVENKLDLLHKDIKKINRSKDITTKCYLIIKRLIKYVVSFLGYKIIITKTKQ